MALLSGSCALASAGNEDACPPRQEMADRRNAVSPLIAQPVQSSASSTAAAAASAARPYFIQQLPVNKHNCLPPARPVTPLQPPSPQISH